MSYRNRKLAPAKDANPWTQRAAQPDAQAGPPKQRHKNGPPAGDRNSQPVGDEKSEALKKSEAKFSQAHRQHVESARKYTQSYESSEEEDNDDGGKGAEDRQTILGAVLRNYNGVEADVGKTKEYLQNLLESRSAVCLICIGTVKRPDMIWSCQSCYTFFHLLCIQRWANDSMSLKRMHQEQQEGYYNNRGEYVPKPQVSIVWDCPKCRNEYAPSDIPRHYECFCGKEQNPENHLWLIPHSCGETCRKSLQPDCGHRCLLLCHPGPCPPCPQTIGVSCCCGKSPPKTIRCSQKSWTCLKTCTNKLTCGIHECGSSCHEPGQCPPCRNRSKQPCICGASTKEVNCFESRWQCGKVCGKSFSCGLHRCEQRCHDGECGECPLGLPRTCPCGKNRSIAACTEIVGTCGDTCQKFLECQLHHCAERCHPGPCGQCLELVKKSCRCGLTEREVACHKQLSCENKCKNVRSCGKHPCNRKCCDEQCPPCDKICGKTLSCGRHKCSSLCHRGQCYPCNLKSTIKCRCGGTTAEVPCGRERKANAPKCKLPCRIHSKCHHTNPHHCHQGECPPCGQVCGLANDTTKCQHPCEAKCHDAVKIVTKDKNFKPVGPWDIAPTLVEIKQLPHPPCEIKVPVSCIGGHEIAPWPCHSSKPTSCGRPCGRALRCGRHTCPLTCHKVSNRESMEEESRCQSCESGCLIPRPEGCVHPCKRPCHPEACNPCQAPHKTSCHCGLTQLFYKCHEYFPLGQQGMETLNQYRDRLLSCGQKCIKNLPCGHRCTATCHPGGCPNPDACGKKVKITCECRSRKAEVACSVAHTTKKALECDERCVKLGEQKRQEQSAKEMLQRELQEEENRRELEEYEKKIGGRKKQRDRKRQQVEETEPVNYWLYMLPVGVAVIAVLLYFFVVK